MRRELPHKKLISCPFSLLPWRRRGPNRRNSLYFPSYQGIWHFRDEFAADSPLQRGVKCEPDFLDQEAVSLRSFPRGGPRVRILLPPATRWYGAGGEGDGTIVAGK